MATVPAAPSQSPRWCKNCLAQATAAPAAVVAQDAGWHAMRVRSPRSRLSRESRVATTCLDVKFQSYPLHPRMQLHGLRAALVRRQAVTIVPGSEGHLSPTQLEFRDYRREFKLEIGPLGTDVTPPACHYARNVAYPG